MRRLRVVAVLCALMIVAPAPSAWAAEGAKPTPSPSPSPSRQTTSKCDPNYSGCVPVASDVDCAGGRGNGPKYVRGPVKVIGNDIYGLDADRDGIGCER